MSDNSPQNARARSLKHFSRVGFHPLPNSTTEANMTSRPSNDVEHGIPLEQVQSNGTGFRQQSKDPLWKTDTAASTSSSTQKRNIFRGRRHNPKSGLKSKNSWESEEDALTAMGKLYKRVMDFSLVTRYFLYVTPLGVVFAVPIIVGAVSGTKATLAHVPLVWFFVWIEVVWVSLWVSKLFARLLPYIFQALAGVVSSGVRKYKVVIASLEIPVSMLGWAITALATFVPVMTQNPTSRYWEAHPAQSPIKNPTQVQGWEVTMRKVLGSLVVATLLYLVEKLIIQLISINYHRKQFSSRIKESKRNLWLLGLLYDASRTLFPQYCNEFAEEDYAISDQLNISRGLGLASGAKSSNRTGSNTPMRLIQDVGRIGDKITSAFGHVAHEVTGREVFNPNSAHSIVVQAMEHRRTSEALAKRIWMSFVVEGRETLTQDDILDVLGMEHKDEADEAFAILDRDSNGDVSLDEMVLTVVDFSRERKAIASSIHDVDQAINVLDRLLMVVVFIAVVLVFIAFLVADFTTTLATAGTALLSLSFVFSVTCQEVLGSCIFLFVKHPYDIGDRVNLGGTPGGVNGNAFVVEHISLLFTVFRHMQGLNCGQMCQIPNIVLNTLWVENVSRSKAMSEQFNINVSFDTSFSDIQILKNEMLNFVTDKENSRDFMPVVDIDIVGTTDQSSLTLMVEIKHKSNWANETVRRARRSKFVCALIAALRKVPIYAPGGGVDAAGSAANPNYSVTITNGEAKEYAQESAKAREDARLVPTKSSDGTARSPTIVSNGNQTGAPFLSLREENIVGNLTTRNPASDPRDDTWRAPGGADNGSMGERPSMDRADAEELRGILRRQSTRGKRKPSQHDYQQSVPTIHETSIQPQTSFTSALAPPSYISQTSQQAHSIQSQAVMSENEVPTNNGVGASASTIYRPPPRLHSTTGYQIPPGSHATSPVEMRQIQSASAGRAPGNSPYRGRSDSAARKPLAPPQPPLPSPPAPRPAEDEEDEFTSARPYSGV